MTVRTVCIGVVLTGLLSVCCLAASDQPTKVQLDILGVARDPQGRYFAIVRGHGLVQEGDVIPVLSQQFSCKVRILSIDRDGLKTETFDVVRKEEKPDPAVKPKEKYEFRDPFWPVGYDPRST